MNLVWKRAVLSSVIGLIGLGLIVYSTHWVTAVGVFLVIWGDNLDKNHKS